jgi:hypothetical protein
MRLSHEKIVHLSHLLLDAILDDDRVDYHGEENEVRQRIVALLKAELERPSATRSSPRSAESPKEAPSGSSSTGNTTRRS